MLYIGGMIEINYPNPKWSSDGAAIIVRRLFGDSLGETQAWFSGKLNTGLVFKPKYGDGIIPFLNPSIILRIKRYKKGDTDTYVTICEEEASKFEIEYAKVKANALQENRKLTEMVRTLKAVLGISLSLNNDLTIAQCEGKGFDKWLNFYDIYDVMENAEPVIEAMKKVAKQNREAKDKAFEEFNAEMESLGIFRKMSIKINGAKKMFVMRPAK
jgi:hypothetical protein